MLIQIRWLTVLLALSLLPTSTFSQQQPASSEPSQVEELTLEQALALALKENRQVKIVGLEYDKFGDRLAVLKTRRLPLFEFSLLATELINTVEFNLKKGDLGSFSVCCKLMLKLAPERRPVALTFLGCGRPLHVQMPLWPSPAELFLR